MCRHCGVTDATHGFSRRDILRDLGAAGAAVPLLGAPVAEAEPAETPAPSPAVETPLLRVAYLRPKGKYWLGWPGTSWDPEGFAARSREIVERFARDLKMKVDFAPEPLYDNTAVSEFIESLQQTKPQGVLLFPLHIGQWPSVNKIAKLSDVPTIIFAALGMCFTKHVLQLSRQPGVYLASSSDFELGPVRFGMKLIRARNHVRRAAIAVVRGSEEKEQTLEPFGLHLKHVPRERFPEAFQAVGTTPEVTAMAEEYTRNAKKCVEPTRDDLLNASTCYFAALKIMQETGCTGITMDCLGLVQARKIPTPPCMAWARLLDAGRLGVCEADLNTVMSQLLCVELLDKPGFPQDPVPETVHNTLIGAHCVCPTRLHGFDKPPAPFILRSHSESNIGVSLQVLWEPGETVTVMQFMGAGKMILGRGKVLRNHDTPPAGGCRTAVELALEAPADARDTKGFHQLFIAGDHVRDFQAYGQMWGIATESI
jgi:hypothetical protein